MDSDILSHFGGQEGVAGPLAQLEAGTGELCLKVWPGPDPGPGGKCISSLGALE